MVIVDLNCPSNARAARTSVLPFRLNAFEQFGVRSIEVVSEFHRCFQSFGVHFETFSQFPGRGIVKEREVLIEIWHNQFVAQFLIMRHAAESHRMTDSSLRNAVSVSTSSSSIPPA